MEVTHLYLNQSNFFSHTLAVCENAIKQQLVPSICVAVGWKDHVLAEGCYGKTSILDDAVWVQPDTIYDMASLSKLMGPTMIALRLIARGELDLADTLPKLFGHNPGVPADKKDITVFHLMTHTSGFLASVRMDQLLSGPDQVLPYLLQMTLNNTPGKKVEYSCLGYILLGMALERLTGKTLDQLAQDEVFGPLGMSATGYHPLNQPIQTTNTAYTERSTMDGSWLVGRVHDENAFLLGGVSGNAGVFSTLDDCIRFARMLACHGILEHEIYLPECILNEALRVQTPWSDNLKGLGFDLTGSWNGICGPFFGHPAAGHTGFTGTAFYLNPENDTWVIILSNRVHPTRKNQNMERIRHLVFNTFASEFCNWQRKG